METVEGNKQNPTYGCIRMLDHWKESDYLSFVSTFLTELLTGPGFGEIKKQFDQQKFWNEIGNN